MSEKRLIASFSLCSKTGKAVVTICSFLIVPAIAFSITTLICGGKDKNHVLAVCTIKSCVSGYHLNIEKEEAPPKTPCNARIAFCKVCEMVRRSICSILAAAPGWLFPEKIKIHGPPKKRKQKTKKSTLLSVGTHYQRSYS